MGHVVLIATAPTPDRTIAFLLTLAGPMRGGGGGDFSGLQSHAKAAVESHTQDVAVLSDLLLHGGDAVKSMLLDASAFTGNADVAAAVRRITVDGVEEVRGSAMIVHIWCLSTGPMTQRCTYRLAGVAQA